MRFGDIGVRWGCRIGKIRPKHGLMLIPKWQRSLDESHVKDMHRSLDTIAGFFEDDLAGLVIVGYDFKGNFSRATKTHVDAPWGPTTLPAFVAEILRRDSVSGQIEEEA